ncbi:erythromycin esterase [Actinopolyspora mzabensis]|uniref:Erythromycin esterase n=1 Tax=Actinopolyspora mzabensis TaxID=995066 RepID=A0A1G8VTT8_ACTMZ|nr:erythromycin esterase family protein [Actinopolyspora mzabensis]SDJ69273.1 erythromycin esterase [Actinopolyspora mzabensis]
MTAATGLHEWIAARTRSLPLGPQTPPLPESLSRAAIVGLASSVRSAGELVAASRVLLRGLVERAGFRAVAIEGTSETALALDRYVRTGDGDPARLIAASQGFLRTREALDIVRWLRNWTEAHPDDPVSIVHDGAHVKRPVGLAEIETYLASSDLAWHARTGQRIVHLGGTAHVVAGDPRTVPPDQTHRNAGGIMRAELGGDYGVAALTVGSGKAPFPVPPPPYDFTEHAFAEVPHEVALLELENMTGAPQPVTDWSRSPLRTRMIGPHYEPTRDHDFRVDAGPLHECLDVLIHTSRITATKPLTPA